MPESKWFESWFDTGYYHLLYQERDEEEAEAFVRRFLGYLNLPQGSRICDLACGSGRHSRVMASLGYEVMGLDLSSNNIAQARAMGLENTQFRIHDMRDAIPNGPYHMVVNLFTSFGYFETDGEHIRTLSHIADALGKTGIFAIDYLNIHHVRKHLIPLSQFERDGVHFEIRRSLSSQYIQKDIKIFEKDKSISFQERVRAFDLSDFSSMLEKVGMEIEEVFGDYDLTPFDKDKSPRLIIISRKA
jgi:cyclopropane fatty-acyl-phospholipid synthase-like methyltransferase